MVPIYVIGSLALAHWYRLNQIGIGVDVGYSAKKIEAHLFRFNMFSRRKKSMGDRALIENFVRSIYRMYTD